jgi:hypothetical protein
MALPKPKKEDSFTDEFNKTKQQEKACKALEAAKELEQKRIAAGWTWQKQGNRTTALTPPDYGNRQAV